MKIELIGINDFSSEYDAALTLKTIFENELSQLKGTIYIKPNLTLLGNNAEQLDLVVWGQFENGFTTPYNLNLKPKDPNNDFQQINDPISTKLKIQNFFLVIEVKDNLYNNIKKEGNDLFVQYFKDRYHFDWHNASEQSKKQVHTVRNGLFPFLRKYKIEDKNCPQIANLIWLRNIKYPEVKNLEILNILPATFDTKQFLQIIANTNPPVGLKTPSINFIRGRIEENMISEVVKDFFESFYKEIYLKSGGLSRKKIEEVIQTQINIEEKPYFNEIGKKLILFTGEPGSGKTIHLFQMAFSLYARQGKRCLLLTYNKALEADLNRLSYLAGVNTDSFNPTVKIQTIQSFFYQIMKAYGLFDVSNTDPMFFLTNYNKLLVKLDDIIEAHWIDEVEKDNIKKDIIKFNWDYILIDESQDWERLERDILYKLYKPQNFIIAYGDRQFVRKPESINWTEYCDKPDSIVTVDVYDPIINLKKTFRQKRNIVDFQNRLFPHNSWKLKSNSDLLGGKVSIYTNDFAKIDLDSLLSEINEENAAPFDLLMLMPKSYYNFINQLNTFKDWGHDGINGIEKVGRIENLDINKFRCFHYESCRGLEGWIVVCHWFDEFLQSKYDSYQRDARIEKNMTDEEAKMRFMSDWAFMATSRAMNHLVITVKDEESKFGKLLIDCGKKSKDFTFLD
jgi:hypothetical protein